MYFIINYKNGQLGLGNATNSVIPTLIPSIINITQISAGNQFSFLLNNNNQVYSFGSNNVF